MSVSTDGACTGTSSWVTELPSGKERRFERRIGIRVPVDGVELRWAPREAQTKKRREIRRKQRRFENARVIDVSLTGIGLVAGSGFAVGSVMEAEHAGGRALLEIRWSRTLDGAHARYGCAFVGLDDVFRQWVSEAGTPHMRG